MIVQDSFDKECLYYHSSEHLAFKESKLLFHLIDNHQMKESLFPNHLLTKYLILYNVYPLHCINIGAALQLLVDGLSALAICLHI